MEEVGGVIALLSHSNHCQGSRNQTIVSNCCIHLLRAIDCTHVLLNYRLCCSNIEMPVDETCNIQLRQFLVRYASLSPLPYSANVVTSPQLLRW